MLTVDRDLLAFEDAWRGPLAAKDEAIVVTLGLTPARYQQRLLALLDDGDAEAAFPQLIHRLRRLELARADARRARAVAVGAPRLPHDGGYVAA